MNSAQYILEFRKMDEEQLQDVIDDAVMVLRSKRRAQSEAYRSLL